MIYLIISGWLVCAFFSAGIAFSYYQHKYPFIARRDILDDAGWSILGGLVFGPIGLAVSFFLSEFAKYGVWRKYDDRA